jgi:hypothetical protein
VVLKCVLDKALLKYRTGIPPMLAMFCENCPTSPKGIPACSRTPLDRKAFLSTLPNLLSQLDNLLAVSKQWMCIKIYLRRKICSSFVLPCNVFTDYLFNCTPLAYLFMCDNKYVILRLLLMVIFFKQCVVNPLIVLLKIFLMPKIRLLLKGMHLNNGYLILMDKQCVL